jgi:hypothetical protein
MPKPACPKCMRFFRPKKNGIVVNEQMPVETAAEPGDIDPTAWKPYKIWMADLWECEGCGFELISGWGPHPAAENYEDCFAEAMKYVTHTINDC